MEDGCGWVASWLQLPLLLVVLLLLLLPLALLVVCHLRAAGVYGMQGCRCSVVGGVVGWVGDRWAGCGPDGGLGKQMRNARLSGLGAMCARGAQAAAT